MKFLHFIKPVLVLAFALSGTTASLAAPVTYYVDRTFETGSVTGSIVTDGRIGTVDSKDGIMAWNLHLVSGANSFDLNASNSYLFGSGLVTATSHDLLYDFNSGNYFGFFINGTVGSSTYTQWCLQSSKGQCSFSGDAGESAAVADHYLEDQFKSRSGVQVIASVPEPEAYGMLLAGLGCLAWFGRRRSGN